MISTVTVVIPTYNRTDRLSRVLDSVLMSDIKGLQSVEIIVVDDGSTVPVKPLVESKQVEVPFTLKYLSQPNSGPGAARNHGFRKASHEIVLFVDDDILVFPDLIALHMEAHRLLPGSVIFGKCPYFPVEPSTAPSRYLNSLVDEGFEAIGVNDKEGFFKMEIIASGNLSVEKGLFEGRDAYGHDLKIPVGEEYELSAYLAERNIPIYFSPKIQGWHLQPATLEDCCEQNYKYGLGIAELAAKRPDVLKLDQPRKIYETNREIRADDPTELKAKKAIRRVLASKWGRKILTAAARTGERIIPIDRLLFYSYRLAIGSYFAAGILDGIKLFAKEKQEC